MSVYDDKGRRFKKGSRETGKRLRNTFEKSQKGRPGARREAIAARNRVAAEELVELLMESDDEGEVMEVDSNGDEQEGRVQHLYFSIPPPTQASLGRAMRDL